MSLHQASHYYGIAKTTLLTRFKRAKEEMGDSQNLTLMMGLKHRDVNNKFATKQVLTMKEEENLAKYLLECSKMNYGLTLKDTRKLAYTYAVSEGRTIPNNWSEDKMAGKAWARGFLRRHKELSVRKPENTSAARNLGFNKESVFQYFQNLTGIMNTYSFGPDRIYNIDETGLSTVLRSQNVVAGKSMKQVGMCVSAERSESVTIVGIVNAAGEYIPPVIIFPRKRHHPEYMEGCVDGALPLFNTKGYMDATFFLRTLEHFKNHVQVSIENPLLLILDNHSSHLSLEALRFCRNNGIHMITLPPHTSHKTQPLDLAVFYPFKEYCVSEFQGKKVTVHNIARFSAMPFKKSFTSSNIKSGFRAGGIYPLDGNKLFKFFEDREPITSSQSSYHVSTNAHVNIKTALNSRVEPELPINISGTSYQPILDLVDRRFEMPMDDRSDLHVIADPSTSPEDTQLSFEKNMNPMKWERESSALENAAFSANFCTDTTSNPIFHQIPSKSHVFSNSFDSVEERTMSTGLSLNPLTEAEQISLTPTEVLDLSISTHKNVDDHEVEVAPFKKICMSNAERPIDLSMKTSTFSSDSRLRFGGLEVLRPLPNPQIRHLSKQRNRGMTSAIPTGSPEFKRKEKLAEEKRLKEEKKQQRETQRRLIKEPKKEIKKRIKKEPKEETKKNPISKENPQKKRGRPSKQSV
ncbi:uncharacterized protein LOC129801939 [Phlebotomus papatasi]|uniref:uncharacterized protein LOC129801939 n=1 Tax=Phlebotomus papatasi TaxID=29031 RepID=UPI002483E61B|nr:uncharacterized protein LOC129801939 [Phlebotomus papatasi]